METAHAESFELLEPVPEKELVRAEKDAAAAAGALYRIQASGFIHKAAGLVAVAAASGCLDEAGFGADQRDTTIGIKLSIKALGKLPQLTEAQFRRKRGRTGAAVLQDPQSPVIAYSETDAAMDPKAKDPGRSELTEGMDLNILNMQLLQRAESAIGIHSVCVRHKRRQNGADPGMTVFPEGSYDGRIFLQDLYRYVEVKRFQRRQRRGKLRGFPDGYG